MEMSSPGGDVSLHPAVPVPVPEQWGWGEGAPWIRLSVGFVQAERTRHLSQSCF